MIRICRDKLTLHTTLLVLIMTVAIINRFYGLDRLSLWADELWVVMASSKGSLADMLGFVYWQDNHPPGHYLFTRYWQLLFGDSDFTIRFPFAVCGIFLVYSTYAIGKKYYARETGLIAAALVSSSWQMIYYSQEARANIMVAVAALWSLHYFYRFVFIARPASVETAAPFWLLATITAYLHYAGTVFVGSLGLLWLLVCLAKRERALVKTGLVMFVPVSVLYLPWAGATYYRLTHTPPGAWWQRPEWGYLYENFKWIFGFGSRILWLYQLAAALLVLLAISALLPRARFAHTLRDGIARFVASPEDTLAFSACTLFMIIVPVMIFFLKSRVSQPVYDYRHFIYTLPMLTIVAGLLVNLALDRVAARWHNLALAVTVLVLLLAQNYYNILGKLYTGPHFKAEYRQTVETLLRNRAQATQPAYIVANSPFFDHYLARNDHGRTADNLLILESDSDRVIDAVKVSHSKTLYFLEMPKTRNGDMVSGLDRILASHFRATCRTRFVYAQVIRFDVKMPTVETDWAQVPDCR